MKQSNADRQREYRNRKRNAQTDDSVTRVTVDPARNAQVIADIRTGPHNDARIGADVYYVPRNHPERLNWGEHMTAVQLKDAGLVANRVAIPGDWDYTGCVDDTVTPAVLRSVA